MVVRKIQVRENHDRILWKEDGVVSKELADQIEAAVSKTEEFVERQGARVRRINDDRMRVVALSSGR